jgi:hypothetical protein
MNLADEVLCTDRYDKVKCKPISMVSPTDKILFKAVDLEDPTNPGNAMLCVCLSCFFVFFCFFFVFSMCACICVCICVYA